MIILGIETSCDETAAAVLQKDGSRIKILSNIIASSQQIHIKYGGIVPEQAAREQIKSILPVIQEALTQAFPDQPPETRYQQLDAIAVTYGPGLVGSLLVGVETAKTLSLLWNKPIIPVNHLMAHFYANWIQNPEQPDKPTPSFPCIGLLVSGGHSDIILLKGHNDYEHLGGTRDDAAGECFDKCARLLDLPYPGGPNLSKLAQNGDPSKFKLPIPMQNSHDLDFSFSGLKTAVLQIVQNSNLSHKQKADLASSVQNTIISHLVDKLNRSVQIYKSEDILVAGGVAANESLRERLQRAMPDKKVFIPPINLCTDNGAVIAARAFFERKSVGPLNLQTNPNLSLKHLLSNSIF